MTVPPSLVVQHGDAMNVLRTLPSESVHCCVTSPPYWLLRSYLSKDDPLKHLELGSEPTPELFVQNMVQVFREVRRVLRKDGTCWINLGDSYAGSGQGFGDNKSRNKSNEPSRGVAIGSIHGDSGHTSGVKPPHGLKSKDLVGIPWMVAFALRADGWYLRQDIIWHKPNPMPESVTDRCTKAHEYLFLLSKSTRYYYDAEAIKERCSESTHARVSQDLANQIVSHRANGGGKMNGPMKAVIAGSTRKIAEVSSGIASNKSFESALGLQVSSRNKRSVWSVPSAPYREAHFATFPPDLIKPCILAGCPIGGTVLDPFAGSGTTGQVALELGRQAVLIELNEKYLPLIQKRTNVTPGLPL